MLDQYGRNITYLRISITDRCNLRCKYCMPDGVTDVGMKNILTFEEIWEIVRAGVSLGITHVRITGGEPLVRKGCVDLIRGIRAIPGVETITMTTNGVLLRTYAASLKEAGLDGLNVSLDTLDFEEFATANGIQPQTIEYLRKCYDNKETVTEAVHQSLLKLFQYYIIVGGMPAVVQKFVDTKDIGEVLKIQKDILDLYRQDISKYADSNKEKIKSIFDLIPAQLNDKNRRFTLSDIKNSARMLRYETSFNWLADAGVALPCYNITEPVLPLELNLQNNLFKLFLCDTGLLCAASMGNIQFDILSGDLSVNMGSILENVFAQELVSNGFLLRYFNKKNIGEIDFIVQKGKSAVPIEIKSGNDYTKHKALDNLIAKQSWNINSGIVFCKGNLEIESSITYYPWYMSMFFKQETLPEHLKVNVDIVNI